MDRNTAYKMRSTKFSDASKARAQRFAEQKSNRRNARENLRNANRGLSEIDQNICTEKPSNIQIEKQPARELTHQEKLQERLVRLKEWREQKKVSEQKAKAKKKAPFLVPGVSKINSRQQAEDQNTSCIDAKTCLKNTIQPKKNLADKSWSVTSHDSSVKKPVNKPFKPEYISFAPKSFNFSVSQGSTSAGVSTGVVNEQKTKPQVSTQSQQKRVVPTKTSPPRETIQVPSLTTKIAPAHSKVMEITPKKIKEKTPKKTAAKLKTPSKPKPINDGSQFRTIMTTEADRLNQLCDTWNNELSADEVPEEEQGSVRTVIGQAQLLQRERFKQFAGLIDQYENNSGEKEITPTDLQGFWELVYIQVEDVINKFEKLEALKNNGWIRHDSPLKLAKAGLKKKLQPARPAAGKSNFRAFLNARKNQSAAKSPKTPSRRSSLHFASPFRTPGSGKSLRKQAIINSAKKPVFLVSDMTEKENTPFDVSSPMMKQRDAMSSIPALDSPCISPGVKPRRSVSGKKGTPKRASGRPSLLPVFQLSPVTPTDDLMSFD